MDIASILEAGLQANAAASNLSEIAGSASSYLPTVEFASDCCGSNNYPDSPPSTIPN